MACSGCGADTILVYSGILNGNLCQSCYYKYGINNRDARQKELEKCFFMKAEELGIGLTHHVALRAQTLCHGQRRDEESHKQQRHKRLLEIRKMEQFHKGQVGVVGVVCSCLIIELYKFK